MIVLIYKKETRGFYLSTTYSDSPINDTMDTYKQRDGKRHTQVTLDANTTIIVLRSTRITNCLTNFYQKVISLHQNLFLNSFTGIVRTHDNKCPSVCLGFCLDS